MLKRRTVSAVDQSGCISVEKNKGTEGPHVGYTLGRQVLTGLSVLVAAGGPQRGLIGGIRGDYGCTVSRPFRDITTVFRGSVSLGKCA